MSSEILREFVREVVVLFLTVIIHLEMKNTETLYMIQENRYCRSKINSSVCGFSSSGIVDMFS